MTERAEKRPKAGQAGGAQAKKSAEVDKDLATGSAENPVTQEKFDKALMRAAGLPHLAAAHMMVNQAAATNWRPKTYTEKENHAANLNTLAQMLAYEPKDALEGMLVSQMIGTHNAVMECLRRSHLNEQSFEGRDQNLKHAARLMAIFTSQAETLDKHRNRGQQKITVEHVTVNAGGQAIVGGVDVGGGAQARATPAQPLALTNDPGPLAPVIEQSDFVAVEPAKAETLKSRGK